MKRRRPPTTGALSRLVGYSGKDTRRLAISDAVWFRLTNQRFHTLLRGSPNLQYLEVRKEQEVLEVPPELYPKGLSHLVLGQLHPPLAFLEALGDSLIHLHLESVESPYDVRRTRLPYLPQLRFFRIIGNRGSLSTVSTIASIAP